MTTLLRDQVQVTAGPVVDTLPHGDMNRTITDRARCEVMAGQPGQFQGAVITLVKKPLDVTSPVFPTGWTPVDRIDNPNLSAASQLRRNITAVSATTRVWSGAIILAYQPLGRNIEQTPTNGPLTITQLTALSTTLVTTLEALKS
ncbi:hypothetical protein [Williamsia sp. CHRR-6]|uniref:hypothetical protein n=1 Tax=Williamsia sp. CHRR-6 TaxID=2835871 RepID=UPI001BDAA261|nr:hypothetical protein [Williamsia sp. CHRR-6]MBT0566263.1 hypothetical protein [Williamsia sp. CHRR-6]